METWIVISTVCFQIIISGLGGGIKEVCVPIATVTEVDVEKDFGKEYTAIPITKEGEKAYKVCQEVETKIEAWDGKE